MTAEGATDIAALQKEIEKKTGKTAGQLYEEREKRVRDAIELKEPDRVPITFAADPSFFGGVPRSAAYYEPVAWKMAVRQLHLDFEPDLANPGFANSGQAWETLEVKNRLWPGGNLPPDYEYQFVEGEYMKADEYDIFLNDPTDFMLRHYLPRVYGALAPLADLPPLDGQFVGFEAMTVLFARPEFARVARALSKAGHEMEKFRELTGNAGEELAQLGFPAFSHPGQVSVGGAPFDTLSSSLRGMKGSMLDMYRQPEKLLKACDVILDRRIARSKPADPNKRGNPKRIGMPLWRGDKVFMSDSQFKKFYWPGLKRAMQAVIDLGYIPMPFFEAEFGDRLEYLLDLPKGKVIASVENVDLPRAKEILGGHQCVLGRAPHSLRLRPLAEVEAFYKDMIKTCGKRGGFILWMALPRGKTEDIQAMLDSIKKFARY